MKQTMKNAQERSKTAYLESIPDVALDDAPVPTRAMADLRPEGLGEAARRTKRFDQFESERTHWRQPSCTRTCILLATRRPHAWQRQSDRRLWASSNNFASRLHC